MLGLKRRWKRPPAKTEGLCAGHPNEYLHVDTTIWVLDNGVKAYIAFVSDNYSRAVLGWNMALKNTAANVKAALDKAIRSIHHAHPEQLCATLVADGGSENHALTIEELLQQTERPEITKVIALRDIRFSNSPVEAVNRVMKRYLRHYRPGTEAALKKVLAKVVHDYNDLHPHGSIKGRTPSPLSKSSPTFTQDSIRYLSRLAPWWNWPEL